MILGTEKYIYSLFGGISEQKKWSGTGSRGWNTYRSIAQHYVSWDNTKHIEMEIFTFLGDFTSGKSRKNLSPLADLLP